MKKIFLALAILASMQFAGAQVKSEGAAKSAVEAAEAAAANAKKATKVATWTKLGQAYLDAYNAPLGNAWIGATKQDLTLVMGGKRPISSETVELAGQTYTKESYSNIDMFFNSNGQLAITQVTKPVVENPLSKALNAYSNAYKVDAKGSKTKDINEAIKTISQKYVDEAYNAYTLGDIDGASSLFEQAALASATEPYSQIDTNSIYNAGFTAWASKNYERAKTFFEKAISYGYLGEDGDAYAKLADVLDNLGDKEGAKNVLEKGFAAYPQSQGILIGLINYYNAPGNQNFDRLFELLDEAKKNEPNNVTLFYTEGNIHKQLGNIEDAIAAYRKCAEINPDYEFGYIGEGMLLYDQAVAVQEKAQAELDDAKYMALVEEFEKNLKGCLDPFEKAFEVSKDNEVKTQIAEYLKNAFYRFRDEDASYMDKYNKYADISKNGIAE